jgi:primosomal protein N' (replication factor Y) (superfamily II helicase)
MACHHCGHREHVPERCPCGSGTLARHGAGTERLEHDLTAALDDGAFPVFRLDADTVSSANEVAALLRRFQDAPAGVLLGTQMVAKGHDFPDIALGVVLDADATLRFPDFRAEERTFALIAQLAGRVGRGGEGRVLVQSIAPRARSIQYAARHDSEGFLVEELERRRVLRYPPYSQLVRIVCAAAQTPAARGAAMAIHARLAELDDAEVLGPAALFRLRERERQVLVVKSVERAAAVRAIGAAVQHVASARAHAGVSFSVDVDPQ